jgi:hypothetical protein
MENNDATSDSDEEPNQLKPHPPHFMTPLWHVAATSSRDDSLVIRTTTLKDKKLNGTRW